jgi:DNA-binding SARP family transcriptional activator/predicted ATPase
MLEIRLFGPLRLRHMSLRIGRPARRDVRLVLAYLLLNRDQPVSRCVLARALWPEADESTGLARVRRALHRAAAVLPDASPQQPWIDRASGCVRWNLSAPFLTDLDVFDTLYRRTSWPDAGADPVRLRADLAEAADLASRVLLEGDETPWILDARRDVDRRHSLVLERLADASEALCDEDGAIAAIERLVALEPMREDARRRLMTLFWRRGQTAIAVRQYDELRTLLAEEMGLEPQPETERLLAEIRQGAAPTCQSASSRHPSADTYGFALRVSARRSQPAAPVEPPRAAVVHGARRISDRFVGRRAELAEGVRRLARERLTVVTGPPGCGKSRLALELARDSREVCPAGVYWVDLAEADSAASALRAIAAIASGRPGARPSCSVHQITSALRDTRSLLVLDNCEHIAALVADISESLLWSLPDMRMLVTSCVVIEGDGASTWRLGGLAEAPDLFLDRLRARAAGRSLPSSEQARLQQLCRRLEGLPMAIELAARHAPVLSIDDLARELVDPMELLVSPVPLGMARHRSLRAAMQRSFDLLGSDDRDLLQGVCTLPESFTRVDAEVLLKPGETRWTLLRGLERLVDASLVSVAQSSDGETRYRVLSLMRDYVHWVDGQRR